LPGELQERGYPAECRHRAADENLPGAPRAAHPARKSHEYSQPGAGTHPEFPSPYLIKLTGITQTHAFPKAS
jgi:hypothetical protein